jgi:O-antigen ligase
MAARIDRAIAIGLLAAVVFTALAHGAVEAWSLAIFELIVVALLALWSIKVLIEGRVRVRIPREALPVAALIVVGLVQSVSVSVDGARLSLSKDVEATRGAVVVLCYLFAAFVIAANFFATRERLRALARFLIIYGLAFAVFALVQHFAWDGRFYWLRPNTQTASPFGPFASHNHFAGYVEMLMPLPVAMAVARAARGEAMAFYLFAGAVMGLAIMASLSRGGMISLFASLVFLAVTGAGRGKSVDPGRERRGAMRALVSAATRPSWPVLVVFGAIAAGILLIGPRAIIDRMTGSAANETFFTSRGWIWQDTLLMIGANPLVGVGMGAYRTAYPIYSRSDGALAVSHAHNDYLQALSDCGILGGLIAAWFIVTLFRAMARGARSHDPLIRGLALGGGAGLFALLVHSVFDFNLQIPSNALLFLLLAAAVSRAGSAVAGSRAGATHAAHT